MSNSLLENVLRQNLINIREQIQEDLICLLATQFDDEQQNDEVQRLACQIVVDNFSKIISAL